MHSLLLLDRSRLTWRCTWAIDCSVFPDHDKDRSFNQGKQYRWFVRAIPALLLLLLLMESTCNIITIKVSRLKVSYFSETSLVLSTASSKDRLDTTECNNGRLSQVGNIGTFGTTHWANYSPFPAVDLLLKNQLQYKKIKITITWKKTCGQALLLKNPHLANLCLRSAFNW